MEHFTSKENLSTLLPTLSKTLSCCMRIMLIIKYELDLILNDEIKIYLFFMYLINKHIHVCIHCI